MPGTWNNKGAAGLDGADVTTADLSDQSWWSNSPLTWDFSVWNWENGYLPYLNTSNKFSISSLSMNTIRMFLSQTATLTLGKSGSGAASHDGKYGDTFLVGDTVTITATPEADYVFVEWQDEIGEVMSTDAEYSFEITEDMTLTAVFTLAEEQVQGEIHAGTSDSEDEQEQQDEQKQDEQMQDEQQQDVDTDEGDNTDVAPEPEPAILPQDEDEPEDTGDDSNVGNEALENNDEEDGSEAIEE